MGNETILYYVLEETITDCPKIVKTHFWKKIKPRFFLTEKDGLSLMTVMIPANNKGWKKEKLLGIMRESIKEYPDYLENVEVIIQTKLQELLMQEESFTPVFWKLAYRLLEENFITKKRASTQASIKKGIRRIPESVVLLLGTYFFPEEQIQQFRDVMQPYFPYINQLTIIYETDEERQEELIYDCMDMLYYEYGLVGRVYQGEKYKEKDLGMRSVQPPALYLDFGYQSKLPFNMMKSGGIYIDMLSSSEKEQRIRKKCSEISYFSPRKYLDTMVKSGYDRLVN